MTKNMLCWCRGFAQGWSCVGSVGWPGLAWSRAPNLLKHEGQKFEVPTLRLPQTSPPNRLELWHKTIPSTNTSSEVLKDALEKLRSTVPRKLKETCHFRCCKSTHVCHQELRDSVEADLKQCGLQEASIALMQHQLEWFLMFFSLRLDNVPAGAGIDANDFFLSFKLACEAVGTTPSFLLQSCPKWKGPENLGRTLQTSI